MTAQVADENVRVTLLMDAFRRLQDDIVIPSDRDAAEVAVEALDRHDEQQGVVRVNLAKQRAQEDDRSRLRAALHAVLTAVENGIAPPASMVEGWRLIAEGGS